MTTVSSDTPLLVRELIKKAGQLGITEEALCHRLAISHSHFSRWRTGLRSAPDPRNSENRVFYKNAAHLLGKSLGEVLSYVIFPGLVGKPRFNELGFRFDHRQEKEHPHPCSFKLVAETNSLPRSECAGTRGVLESAERELPSLRPGSLKRRMVRRRKLGHSALSCPEPKPAFFL